MTKICCISGCTPDRAKTLFTFPYGPLAVEWRKVCEKYMRILKKGATPKLYICEGHFRVQDIALSSFRDKDGEVKVKKFLKDNIVPSIFRKEHLDIENVLPSHEINKENGKGEENNSNNTFAKAFHPLLDHLYYKGEVPIEVQEPENVQVQNSPTTDIIELNDNSLPALTENSVNILNGSTQIIENPPIVLDAQGPTLQNCSLVFYVSDEGSGGNPVIKALPQFINMSTAIPVTVQETPPTNPVDVPDEFPEPECSLYNILECIQNNAFKMGWQYSIDNEVITMDYCDWEKLSIHMKIEKNLDTKIVRCGTLITTRIVSEEGLKKLLVWLVESKDFDNISENSTKQCVYL